jgi:hypothetical protein
MSLSERFAQRLTYLFHNAERLSAEDARGIRAKAAAEGLLQSGTTLKRLVAAIEVRAGAAVQEALASLDRRVLSPRTREQLLAQLKAKLQEHYTGEVRAIPDARPFGGAAQSAVEKLLRQSEERLVIDIDQHATGFAPSSPASWVTAHPTLTFAITTGASLLAIAVSLVALLANG